MSGSLRLRDAWPLYAGMTIAAAAAVVASASTLADLARAAGWTSWTPWLLPAALDVGGTAAGWCWLRPGAADGARRFGRTVALVGGVASLVGNAAGHLVGAGYLRPGPALVIVVGAVPAAILVALAHLAALLVVPSVEVTGEPERAPEEAEPCEPSVGEVVTDIRAVVVRELGRGPGTVAELVARTGRSRSTVVGHLKAMADEGLVVRDDAKRYRQVTRPHAVTG